ncbi:MAG: hypothetical protein EB141_03840, partial [Verrucomicrobia bacterium]|nr:hypothetical protein [Verrucomicrobiota bacterium]
MRCRCLPSALSTSGSKSEARTHAGFSAITWQPCSNAASIAGGASTASIVTSANFGYTVGKSIAYGYLPAEQAAPGTRAAVRIFDREV